MCRGVRLAVESLHLCWICRKGSLSQDNLCADGTISRTAILIEIVSVEQSVAEHRHRSSSMLDADVDPQQRYRIIDDGEKRVFAHVTPSWSY
jgi:hypothetical protein